MYNNVYNSESLTVKSMIYHNKDFSISQAEHLVTFTIENLSIAHLMRILFHRQILKFGLSEVFEMF